MLFSGIDTVPEKAQTGLTSQGYEASQTGKEARATVMMVPNPGYNAGINDPQKHSKIERLAWAWKGAQKTDAKERRLSALQAVTEGRKLSETFSGKLSKAGGEPGDVTVIVVFADRENLGVLVDMVTFHSPDPLADTKDLEAARRSINAVPIGYVICVQDREKGNPIAHYRPWILEQPALNLLQSLVEEIVSPVTGALFINGKLASLRYSWEPLEIMGTEWELAATFYVVPAPAVKSWIAKGRATSEKWVAAMSSTLPRFDKRLKEILPLLNELGLSLTALKPGFAKTLEAVAERLDREQ